MKKFVFTAMIFMTTPVYLYAQCAMCRAVLESEEGQSTAQAVNDGIVYLMIIPYVLVAGIGFLIYRKFYKNT